MLISRVTPQELRERPDQFCATLNRVIDYINKQEKTN